MSSDIRGVRIALVTLFLIIVAMAVGYRRGTVREALTTVVLVFFTSLLSTATGFAFITSLNQLGQIGARTVASLLKYVPGAPLGTDALNSFRLVPAKQQEAFLFLLFLVGVVLAYRMGDLVGLKKASNPSAGGALFGLLNAYILALILLPDLPDAVPAPQVLLNSAQMTQQAAETFRLVAQSIGVTFTTDTLMTLILVLVAALMYWAVGELR